MKRILFTLLAVIAGYAGAVIPQRSLSTTALALLLVEQPTADLRDAKVKARLQTLEAEVARVYDAALTTEGKAAFWLHVPFEPGKLSIGFDQTTEKAMEALLNGQKSFDLTKNKTGIAELDALNAKYGVTSLDKPGYGFSLRIPTDLNPALLSPEYRKVPGVRWAEPNGIMRFGGAEPVKRMEGRPVLYRFTYGWGDCPAGCMANHHWYFEVTRDNVKKLAESGNELKGQEAEPALQYFR